MAGEYRERNRWREVAPILVVAGLILAAAAFWAILRRDRLAECDFAPGPISFSGFWRQP